MSVNLDNNIGCHICTVVCGTHRLNHPDIEMLHYTWCETKSGEGWPNRWMEMRNKLPDRVRDFGASRTFNLEDLYS